MNMPCLDKHGNQRWFEDGIPHREDGPALLYPNGTEYWYYFGQFHRTDGPAVTLSTGLKCWYIHGVLVTSGQHYQQLTGTSDEDMILLVLKHGDIHGWTR